MDDDLCLYLMSGFYQTLPLMSRSTTPIQFPLCRLKKGTPSRNNWFQRWYGTHSPSSFLLSETLKILWIFCWNVFRRILSHSIKEPPYTVLILTTHHPIRWWMGSRSIPSYVPFVVLSWEVLLENKGRGPSRVKGYRNVFQTTQVSPKSDSKIKSKETNDPPNSSPKGRYFDIHGEFGTVLVDT